MNQNIKPHWRHLLVDLDISMAQIGRELDITRTGVWLGLFENKSKNVQRYVLQKAIDKGIQIPKPLQQYLNN